MALKFFGVRRGLLLLRDVWPALGVFGIDFKPLLEPRLTVRLYGLGGAFRFANTAIDALIRMNDEHVLAFVKAIDRANFNAIGIFAFDTGIVDDVSHPRLRQTQFCRLG